MAAAQRVDPDQFQKEFGAQCVGMFSPPLPPLFPRLTPTNLSLPLLQTSSPPLSAGKSTPSPTNSSPTPKTSSIPVRRSTSRAYSFPRGLGTMDGKLGDTMHTPRTGSSSPSVFCQGGSSHSRSTRRFSTGTMRPRSQSKQRISNPAQPTPGTHTGTWSYRRWNVARVRDMSGS